MKKIIVIIISSIVLQSCFDVFDKQPLDRISENIVWNQQAFIEAYVTNIYAQIPFFAWNGYTNSDAGDGFAYGDLATNRHGNSNSVTTGGMSHTNDNFGYWNYSLIREINVFLEKIEDAPIDEGVKKRLKGEILTIRAIVYFEKQKRYGGVPLVDVVLDPFNELDPQYLERSSEEAIADFIDSDLTQAIGLLPESNESKGRINKWVAYAYKARANLWAASIAKYGSVQANGVVGIPAGRASDFFEKASNAAKAVVQSGKYQLYNNLDDKSENYRALFLDDSNSEIIFERLYNGIEINHSFSHNNYPTRFSAGQGSHLNPLLDFLLGYENIDGSTDQPEFGPEYLYEDGIEPWSNKDPRLRASVFLQGEPYGGDFIRTYDGLDPSPVPDVSGIIASNTESYEGTPTVGDDSRLSSQHFRTQSGFLLRKHILNEPLVERNTMKTSWKAIRLAEMYLIIAEAEFELGRPGPAAEALNATRGRAGITLVDAGSITLEKLRNERKNELAFEGFRYWDLRRWRIARDVLHRDTPFQGLRIILHYPTGKFYFFPMNAETFTRTFRDEHYYNPITIARIENNSHLEENPGYN